MHSFSAYSIRVFDQHLPGPVSEKYHDLDSVRGKRLLDYVGRFLKMLETETYIDKKEKRTAYVSNMVVGANSIHGWIEYGEYGIPGKIINIHSKEKRFDKGHEDSDTVALYFQIRIPSHSKRGYMLFHSAGNKGVKQFFSDKFNEFFKARTVNLNAQIRPITHEKSLQGWLDNAEVKEIRLRAVSISTNGGDLADRIGDQNTEYSIKPKKKGGTYGLFRDIFSRETDAGENFVEVLKDLSTDIRTVVSSGKRKKIVRITGGTPISAIEISTDNVSFESGVPDEKDMHSYANDLIDEFISASDDS